MKISIGSISDVILIFYTFFIVLFLLYYLLCYFCQCWKNCNRNKKFKEEYKQFAAGCDISNKDLEKSNIQLDQIILNLSFAKLVLKINSHTERSLWAILIELSTRVILNDLEKFQGKSIQAKNSIYVCFQNIREEIKKEELTSETLHIVLSLLNKQMRPFLTKWADDEEIKKNENEFRKELRKFRIKMLICQEVKLLFLVFGIDLDQNKIAAFFNKNKQKNQSLNNS